MRDKFLVITVSLFLILTACRNEIEQSGKSEFEIDQLTLPAQEIREIFYNMYLPDEMSRLFEKVGANYDPAIINSPDNFSRYNQENHISVILGMYGVDLSYSRLFDQNFTAASFLSSIQILHTKLGITQESNEDLFHRFEKSISNRDSVAEVISELYSRTDTFLKKTGKESCAALVVMGGWVEALFIATNIYETNPDNIEIMNRIAEQKYSLNSLMALLNNYHDDPYIAENILLLKKLKRIFDKFDISFDRDSFVLDTVKQTISAANYKSGLSPEIAVEINQIISDIRTVLIL